MFKSSSVSQIYHWVGRANRALSSGQDRGRNWRSQALCCQFITIRPCPIVYHPVGGKRLGKSHGLWNLSSELSVPPGKNHNTAGRFRLSTPPVIEWELSPHWSLGNGSCTSSEGRCTKHHIHQYLRFSLFTFLSRSMSGPPPLHDTPHSFLPPRYYGRVSQVSLSHDSSLFSGPQSNNLKQQAPSQDNVLL
jgi:hypothetical protein